MSFYFVVAAQHRFYVQKKMMTKQTKKKKRKSSETERYYLYSSTRYSYTRSSTRYDCKNFPYSRIHSKSFCSIFKKRLISSACWHVCKQRFPVLVLYSTWYSSTKNMLHPLTTPLSSYKNQVRITLRSIIRTYPLHTNT